MLDWKERNVRTGALQAMKRKLKYIVLMLQAVGRIIAGLCLLHYKAIFWALRGSMIAAGVAAAYGAATSFDIMAAVGCVLIAVGALFTVWTRRLVMRHPISSGTLICSGTFAVVRHPMYSGMALVAIGLALIAGRWWVTLLMAAYAACMLSFSCAEDEENAEIFGAAYREYSREVMMTGIFIGLLRRLLKCRTGENK